MPGIACPLPAVIPAKSIVTVFLIENQKRNAGRTAEKPADSFIKDLLNPGKTGAAPAGRGNNGRTPGGDLFIY